MANRAASLRADVNRPVLRRGRRFVEFDLGAGQRRQVFTIDPLHYGDGTQEIETAFVPDTGAFQWRMVAADFEARTRSVFNAGNLVEFRKGAEWVVFNPLSLNWINQDTSTQQIATTQAVTGTVSDDQIEWVNAFGSGRSVRYRAHPSQLIKHIVITAATDLPAPTVTGTVWLMVEFQLTNSAGVELYLDGVRWGRATGARVDTAKAIEFRAEATGAVLWRMEAPTAFDSAGQTTTGLLQVRRQGPNYFASVRFPRAWVQSAVFPIVLDPTLTLQPDATAGLDTWLWSSSPTANWGTYHELWIGRDASAVLTHALMKFDLSSLDGTETFSAVTFTLVGATADFTVPTTLSVYRALRTWTEGGATWNTYDGTNNWGTAGAEHTTSDREATTIGAYAIPSGGNPGTLNIALSPTSKAALDAGNGWVLRLTETDSSGDRRIFHSSDEATAGSRPTLVIDYTAGGNPLTTAENQKLALMSWGRPWMAGLPVVST